MVSLAAREWLAEGEAKREARGEIRGRAQMLQRQLARRFGPLPDAMRARIDAAGRDALDRWIDRVLDAPTLEAVL